MTTDLYRYDFDDTVAREGIESALLLAAWGCEALHGAAQTRLDAAFCLDPVRRACVIDAGTPVGRDFNRLFVGFISCGIGADAFLVSRLAREAGRLNLDGLHTDGRVETARPTPWSTAHVEMKQRTCLKCGKHFASTGPGNRICPRCQRLNDRLPRFTEAQLQQQRGAKRHNGELLEPCADE